jgi:hypothetical protein
LRQNARLRALVRETELSVDHLVMPLFVREGTKVRKPIAAMPGQFQLSVDQAVKEAEQAPRRFIGNQGVRTRDQDGVKGEPSRQRRVGIPQSLAGQRRQRPHPGQPQNQSLAPDRSARHMKPGQQFQIIKPGMVMRRGASGALELD